MFYDRITRILHAVIALGIVVQVLVSTVMIVPRPGRVANGWWEIHENLGLFLAVILIVHWLWTIRATIRAGGSYLLFPWFSKVKLTAVVKDVRDSLDEVRRGRFPHSDAPRPAPAALQGAGLLLATWLGLSGTVIAIAIANGGLPPSLRFIREAHGIAGNLMWVYLAVHPVIGVFHEIAGHRTLSRMFRFGA